MKKIYIIGDSISLGYGLNIKELSYVELLKKDELYDILIDAQCGRNLEDAIQDYKTPLGISADILVLFIGTNGMINKEKLRNFILRIKTNKNMVIVCNTITRSENNRIIQECCSECNVILCDLMSKFITLDNLMQLDKIHPNDKGHYIIYKTLKMHLNKCPL